MNIKDLKPKSEKTQPEFTKEGFNEYSKKFSEKFLPLLLKNMNFILGFVFTMFFYFVYSLFAHTKEVVITFLIAGSIIVLPKAISKIKDLLKFKPIKKR